MSFNTYANKWIYSVYRVTAETYDRNFTDRWDSR